MEKEIFQKVRELIAANNSIPEESITMDSLFEELGMDSLDGMALVSDLEISFGINIPNEVVLKIKSVREVVESLQKLLVIQ
jgi:acyl carrier protein